jgi:hypothetical protein
VSVDFKRRQLGMLYAWRGTTRAYVSSSFLAPSSVLADVGARREAIAGQPLAESMRRFEYTQNLPQDQFAKYMASIYGSPLGANTAAPAMTGSTHSVRILVLWRILLVTSWRRDCLVSGTKRWNIRRLSS